MVFVVSMGPACGGAPGKLMVETPAPTKEEPKAVLVPYLAPDVNELAGIEEPDDEDQESTAPAPEPKP